MKSRFEGCIANPSGVDTSIHFLQFKFGTVVFFIVSKGYSIALVAKLTVWPHFFGRLIRRFRCDFAYCRSCAVYFEIERPL